MPLLWLSLAFLSGILLASALTLPAGAWIASAGLFLLLFATRSYTARVSIPIPHSLRAALRFTRSASPLPLTILLIVFALGAARYQLARPRMTPGFIAWYNAGQESLAPDVRLEGIVVKPPDARDSYINLTVSVRQVTVKDGRDLPTSVEGLLLAKVPPAEGWRYGDLVQLEGRLETPPELEGFSYREYLARRGIHAYMPRAEAVFLEHDRGNPLLAAIYALKERALVLVYRIYPDPEASLLAGILLGVESGIPLPVQEAFKATGTSHIIAISGFNITILAGLFAGVSGRLLGKRWGAVAAVLGVSAYTLLVGANAAVLRAAIMGGLSIFARQFGRRQDGLNTLAFVAAVMALFNPLLPWDVGFQLSFAATLGLILYAQPFADAFTGFAARRMPLSAARRLAGPVGEYVLFTFAAQLTTLPVMAYHFGRISLISLVANPFILPAQPAVMIVGGLAVMLGLVWLPLGVLAGCLAWPFVVYTVRVVEMFAAVPAGEILLGEVALAVVVLYYAGMFGLTFAGPRFPAFASTLKPSVSALGVGLLAVLVWRAALAAPDGRLHLTLLDTNSLSSSGEGILIQTPTGRAVLVDGGPSVSLLSNSLGRRMPLTHRGLDWLVVALPGEDQLASLPRVLERFPAGNVLWAGPTHDTRSARNLQAALAKSRVEVQPAVAGQSLELGAGSRLQVLTAGRRGAILLLEWGSFRALLPLGSSFDDLRALKYGEELGPVSVLMLAGSGYGPLNPPEWIANLNPQVVLLSVAAGDWRGMPSQETLEAVEGYPLLRTDRNGWIHISTDGEQMWVEVER